MSQDKRGGRPSGSGQDKRRGSEGRKPRTGQGARPDRGDRPNRSGRPDRSGRPQRPAPEERTEDQKIYDGPPIPDEVTAKDLDRQVLRMLHGLPDKLADRIARHLVMAGHLIDQDPQTAHRHALAARARAQRVAVVREACGETAYAAELWSEALSELRAAKRMNGAVAYVPMMADCERALGRPDKAIALATDAVRTKLDEAGRAELAIVVSHARAQQGQIEAGLRTLERESLNSSAREAWVARLRYAYADLLVDAGRTSDAREWFHRAAAVDAHGATDAEARLNALDAEA